MIFKKHITISRTDEGAVLLDEIKGKYWQLNPVATTITLGLQDGKTEAEVAMILVDKYYVDKEQAVADIKSFVKQLQRANIVR